MMGQLVLLSIPLIAALVGWLTNKLAVWMTFYPIEYVGRRPFGWQGIIPSRSNKMAKTAVTLVTSKLISVEEEFEKLDAQEIMEELRPKLNTISRNIINQVMSKELPLVWTLLPRSQKEAMYRDTAAQFPEAITKLLSDIRSNIHELLDIEQLMVEGLTKEKTMLNRIFLQCGSKEFKFIEHSGFVFGFLFGLLQMLIWNFYQHWWLLPLGGLVVGYITNFLALKLIFRPINPIKIGPIVVQGLFMKRQNEVSEEYSRILAKELLTAEHIFEFVLRNNGMQSIADICRVHIMDVVDNATGATKKTILKIVAGNNKYVRIKHLAAERFVEELPNSIVSMFGYIDRSLEVQATLESKLKSLSKKDFEEVLHPIFREDEFILIVVGAVLGGVAGILQLLLLV